MKHIMLFENYGKNSISLTGYHATDYGEDIVRDNFDESKIYAAFLGRGFYFSTSPDTLSEFNRKYIIEADIVLDNPLTDEDIWLDVVKKISPEKGNISDLKQVASALRDELERMGYDGILAFKKYGWWKDVKWKKNDEIVVFRQKNIIKTKILTSVNEGEAPTSFKDYVIGGLVVLKGEKMDNGKCRLFVSYLKGIDQGILKNGKMVFLDSSNMFVLKKVDDKIVAKRMSHTDKYKSVVLNSKTEKTPLWWMTTKMTTIGSILRSEYITSELNALKDIDWN